MLRQLALHLFGPDERALRAVHAGRLAQGRSAPPIERQTMWIWALTALAVVALALLYRRTTFGRAMRATSIQPRRGPPRGRRRERAW